MAMAKTHPSTDSDATVSNPFEPTVGLLGILRILFRWSFVVAPLAALTVWFALSQTEGIEPEYTAEASMILIGPTELLYENPETGEISVESLNPYQQLGGTLPTVARVTVLELSDSSIATELVDAGLTDNYEIGVEDRSPILIVRAFDSDPDLALRTVEKLTAMVIDNLENRQDEVNAPESNRIGAQLISSGTQGGSDFGRRDRLRLAIAAVGFALSAAAAFFLEGIAELWRRRRRRSEYREFQLEHRALLSGQSATIKSADDLEQRDGRRLVEVLHLATGDLHASRAAAQASFVAAHDLWPLRGDPAVWLYQTALQRVWASEPGSQQDAALAAGPLWDVMADMSRQTRSVLALSYLGELSDSTIGDVLNLSVEAVAARRSLADGHIRSARHPQPMPSQAVLDDDARDGKAVGDAAADGKAGAPNGDVDGRGDDGAITGDAATDGDKGASDGDKGASDGDKGASDGEPAGADADDGGAAGMSDTSSSKPAAAKKATRKKTTVRKQAAGSKKATVKKRAAATKKATVTTSRQPIDEAATSGDKAVTDGDKAVTDGDEAVTDGDEATDRRANVDASDDDTGAETEVDTPAEDDGSDKQAKATRKSGSRSKNARAGR